MGNDTKATLVELLAVSSVAAPFIGYALSEWFGNGVYFILGAGMFCAWMLVVPVMLLGTHKRRIANRTADANTDPAETTDAPSTSDT